MGAHGHTGEKLWQTVVVAGVEDSKIPNRAISVPQHHVQTRLRLPSHQHFLSDTKIYGSLNISHICQTQRYLALLPSASSVKYKNICLLPSAISVRHKNIWLSFHQRFLWGTKVYGSLTISDFCETQKNMTLLPSAISVRHRNIWLSCHQRFLWDTKICDSSAFSNFCETQKYMSLLPSAISVKYKDICLSYHRRFLWDTKHCSNYDRRFLRNKTISTAPFANGGFCETKRKALPPSVTAVRHKARLFLHRWFQWDTKHGSSSIGDFSEIARLS